MKFTGTPALNIKGANTSWLWIVEYDDLKVERGLWQKDNFPNYGQLNIIESSLNIKSSSSKIFQIVLFDANSDKIIFIG